MEQGRLPQYGGNTPIYTPPPYIYIYPPHPYTPPPPPPLLPPPSCLLSAGQTTLTTNDIVISKLTQILSYLRQGTRHRKLKRKDKGKLDDKRAPEADLSIFDDIGDYVTTAAAPAKPANAKSAAKAAAKPKEKEKERHRDEEKGRRHSYFEKPRAEEPTGEEGPGSVRDQIKMINEKFAGAAGSQWQSQEPGQRRDSKEQLGDFFGGSNSYAECYPATMDDLAVDSDEEVDYSKMDQGNKKGPLGRWDFDTQEEYSDYMNNKEALPKAAFQYGIKMSEGRKTRRFKETNEKAELDRQWKKISAIIEKRKKMEADGVDVKRPKY
ncbi:LOW QUALITY PROTEIN: protein Red [Menidia menidia]